MCVVVCVLVGLVGTHHVVRFWLDAAGPHPGVLLADGAQTHAVFGVERGLLVRAAHDDVLALGEVADTAGVIVQEPVLSYLWEEKRECLCV